MLPRLERGISAGRCDIADLAQLVEAIWPAVGAAKALHLLAPKLTPLWDRVITESYGLPLGSVGTNVSRYVRLIDIVRRQSTRGPGRNVIKAIDEYNYGHFTKVWC